MRQFIVQHGTWLLFMLTVVAAFAVFIAGRTVLHQMISAKVHSGMCRTKPDVQVKHSTRLWSRNE